MALVEPDGVTIHDAFSPGYPEQFVGVSWGMSENEMGYFVNPTPGAANGAVASGFVSEEVIASVERGFFEEAFEVALTTEAEGAEIYYTTDGSEPTLASGLLYEEPIQVETTMTLRAGAFRDGEVPVRVMTQSYLFLDDVLDQPNDPSGFPSFWQPSVLSLIHI